MRIIDDNCRDCGMEMRIPNNIIRPPLCNDCLENARSDIGREETIELESQTIPSLQIIGANNK